MALLRRTLVCAISSLPVLLLAGIAEQEGQEPASVNVVFSKPPTFVLRKGVLNRDILDTSTVPTIMGATLRDNRRGVKKIGGETADEEWTPTVSYGYSLTTPAARLCPPLVYLVALLCDTNTALSVWGAQLPNGAVPGTYGTLERVDMDTMGLSRRLSLLSSGTDTNTAALSKEGKAVKQYPPKSPVEMAQPRSVAYELSKLTPVSVDKFKLGPGGPAWTKDKVLGWRIEVWQMGRFIAAYSRQNDAKLKEQGIPADWYAKDLQRLVGQGQ